MTMTLTPARTVADSVQSSRYRGLAALLPAQEAGLLTDITVLTYRRADRGLYPTVDHGAVSSYHALYVCWAVVTPSACSALHQPDPAVVAGARPVLADPDWAALRHLWERWHAESLSPGCSHQVPPTGSVRAQLAATPDCPEDGYRFGSGWLVRPMPEDIYRRAHQLGALLQELPR